MKHSRYSLALLAAAAVALFAPSVVVRAGQSAPAIDAFNAAFSKVTSYTFKLHSHETKGSSVQQRVYDYSFMKPHFAKTLIESGDGKGSGGVWTGGEKVSGHQGGFLSGIHLKVDLHDERATSLRGYTIPDGLPQNIVANYANIPGTLTQAAGGKIDGAGTDVLTLVVTNPAGNGGISKQVLYLSQETHWPLREILYEGSTPVLDQSFTDYNLNANLTQDDFPF
jgi:outer membrane lipoprotein-sorting protein